MNGMMKRTYYKPLCEQYPCFDTYECEKETEPREHRENTGFSGFSMVAVAGGLLMCMGIVLYALLTM